MIPWALQSTLNTGLYLLYWRSKIRISLNSKLNKTKIDQGKIIILNESQLKNRKFGFQIGYMFLDRFHRFKKKYWVFTLKIWILKNKKKQIWWKYFHRLMLIESINNKPTTQSKGTILNLKSKVKYLHSENIG